MQQRTIETMQNTDAELLAIEAYWTEDRMNAARVVEMPELNEEQFQRLMRDATPQVVSEDTVQTIESSPIGPEATGVPERADVGERPFWNGGKFFFSKPDGSDWVGSAEFVGSNRCIMTAAHCLHDGSSATWYKNFLFRRAYSNGGGQAVGWRFAAIYTNYYSSGSPNYVFDYGFLCASTVSGAGWLGFKTQIPYSSFTSIGYPGNYGGGAYMYKVVGNKGTVVNNIVQMKDNPFGGGASGGAWIGDLTIPHVGGNYAIGLNSFIYPSLPGNMYGPLFNTATYNLLTYTINACT